MKNCGGLKHPGVFKQEQVAEHGQRTESESGQGERQD